MPHVNQSKVKQAPIVVPPLGEQAGIVAVMDGVEDAIACQQDEVKQLIQARSSLLSVLLSGEHEIPESYDRFLEEAA